MMNILKLNLMKKVFNVALMVFIVKRILWLLSLVRIIKCFSTGYVDMLKY